MKIFVRIPSLNTSAPEFRGGSSAVRLRVCLLFIFSVDGIGSPSVNTSLVFPKASGLSEAFPAGIASVRSLAGVNAFVRFERTQVSKFLLTFVTRVGFLAAVDSHVTDQLRG